jgi:hypothetical protein
MSVTTASPVEEIARRLEHDIRTNKNLSGIDFSQFLGDVINLASTFLFPLSLMSEEEAALCEGTISDTRYGHFAGESASVRELLVMLMANVLETANHLRQQPGKPIRFMETTKALTAIGLIPIRDADRALEELEALSLRLMASELTSSEIKVNLEASEFFLKLLR